MKENNATCSICGKDYYVCLSCKDAIQLSPWKIHCCSADCYKTYQVVRGFSTGVYTNEEFKSKLKNINLSNLENYREHIKVLIKNALKENEVVETVVEPTHVSRKRNYKVNKVEVDENVENAVVETVEETE